MDGDKTLCGRATNQAWWIETNAFDGTIDCKKCLKLVPNLNLLT